MKKLVSVLVILTLGCTSIFAAEVKSGSKTELFADVAGQELSRADMEKVKGEGMWSAFWLGTIIGGWGYGLGSFAVLNSDFSEAKKDSIKYGSASIGFTIGAFLGALIPGL